MSLALHCLGSGLSSSSTLGYSWPTRSTVLGCRPPFDDSQTQSDLAIFHGNDEEDYRQHNRWQTAIRPALTARFQPQPTAKPMSTITRRRNLSPPTRRLCWAGRALASWLARRSCPPRSGSTSRILMTISAPKILSANLASSLIHYFTFLSFLVQFPVVLLFAFLISLTPVHHHHPPLLPNHALALCYTVL